MSTTTKPPMTVYRHCIIQHINNNQCNAVQLHTIKSLSEINCKHKTLFKLQFDQISWLLVSIPAAHLKCS